jgi:hypothetical protein
MWYIKGGDGTRFFSEIHTGQGMGAKAPGLATH